MTNLDINAPCGDCWALEPPVGMFYYNNDVSQLSLSMRTSREALTNVTPNGKNPNPADIDIPPRLNALFPNGWLKKLVAGRFGSRIGGGLWPAGRVGIDGSFLSVYIVINLLLTALCIH